MSTEGLDWQTLSDRAAVDPGELKRRMDLVSVCLELGIVLEEGQDAKWYALCPFHDDHQPSFSVYEREDGTQACGCFSCDFGPSNDVYDLLRALRGYGFAQALAEAQALAMSTRLSDRPRAAVERKPVELGSLVEPAKARALEDDHALRALLSARGVRVPANWVAEQFGVGITPDGAGVVIPHWSRDGELVAAKVRRQTVTAEDPWRPTAVSGSKLHELYGVWRDRGHRSVVLVEGESDTWTVAWLLRFSEIDVFGLPSGAAARPRREWLSFLEPRDVTTLFDADDAGRIALRNWSAGLGVCRVGRLTEGMDPSKERPERVLEALTHAQVVGTAPTPGLVEAPFGGYVRANDMNQAMVANFTVTLVRTVALEDDEGFVFDVAVPDGRVVSLPSTDLENDSKFRRWANRLGYVWNGTTKDAQEVLRMLIVDGIYKPVVRGTRVAGWTGDAFVFPEPHGTVGSRGWAYVSPIADMEIGKLVDLRPGPWDPNVPAILTRLHRPDVITPIVGWIAAAPLRALVKAFPVLAVVGGAGWGKSTLLRETLATFGYRVNSTLTATTPHAVGSFVASTNSAPVWFDEYRKGAREDTRLAFEQFIRDAWESSSSYKGGLGENRQQVTNIPARAPIVVTGEDAFSETSHLERMALIQLPRLGRDAAALTALFSIDRAGFGRAYLEWLVERLHADALPEPPAIPDRPMHARAVVAWGYSVFGVFASEVCGVDLPAFDATLLERAHSEAASRPVLVEALQVCEGRQGKTGPIVWRDQDGALCVRLHDLVTEAHSLQIQLTGNTRALRSELGERWTTSDETDGWGPYVRVANYDL